MSAVKEAREITQSNQTIFLMKKLRPADKVASYVAERGQSS